MLQQWKRAKKTYKKEKNEEENEKKEEIFLKGWSELFLQYIFKNPHASIAFYKVMWNEGTSQNAMPTQRARTLTPFGVSMKNKIFVAGFCNNYIFHDIFNINVV
jgi:hypothetical protein